MIGLWLEGRGGGGPAEAREAVERVGAFIVAHGASRFESIGGEDAPGETARPVANRAGWRGGGLYYAARSAWAEIHKGADPKRAAQHAAAAGFLEPFRILRRVVNPDGSTHEILAPDGVGGWRPATAAEIAEAAEALDDADLAL